MIIMIKFFKILNESLVMDNLVISIMMLDFLIFLCLSILAFQKPLDVSVGLRFMMFGMTLVGT